MIAGYAKKEFFLVADWQSSFAQIRHLRNENATGAERRPTIVCGVITGDEPVSFWSMFFLSLLTVQKVFANPTQVPYRLLSGDCGRHDGQ